jgi:hypothetical protein
VHPDHVSPAALHPVNVVIAIGKDPLETLGAFTTALKVRRPKGRDVELGSGEALVWFRDGEEPPIRVRTIPGHEQRRRHLRQYAVGALSPDESFYFRGPENKLNLRAQNLTIFQQVADGIDDATWIHHLRQGDYSTWFRQNLKDHDLAAEAERIEQDGRLSPIESRQKIKEAIQSRYTAAV